MTACGEAEGISNARRKIAQCQPQVLVTAPRLGTEDTLKFIKALNGEYPGLRILVYSAFEESVFAERAIRAGANGDVMKKAPKEVLAAAIRDVGKGGLYISQAVAFNAFRKSLGQRLKNKRWRRSADALQELSDRELHVFQLLGQTSDRGRSRSHWT
jgi:DNA-binding NarL/FixJ family response regulator